MSLHKNRPRPCIQVVRAQSGELFARHSPDFDDANVGVNIIWHRMMPNLAGFGPQGTQAPNARMADAATTQAETTNGTHENFYPCVFLTAYFTCGTSTVFCVISSTARSGFEHQLSQALASPLRCPRGDLRCRHMSFARDLTPAVLPPFSVPSVLI